MLVVELSRRAAALTVVAVLASGSLFGAAAGTWAATGGDAFVAVGIAPGGGGSVSDSLGNTCDQASCTFAYGATTTLFEQTVTFTASPAAGMVLVGLTGTGYNASTCAGPGVCTLEIYGSRDVPRTYKLNATFGAAPSSPALPSASASATPSSSFATSMSTLKVTVRGAGMVTSLPSGIDCAATGGACQAAFPVGAQVKLTASPDSGNVLTGWGGACAQAPASGASPPTPAPVTCTVSVTADVGVTAAFGPPPAAAPGKLAFTAPTGVAALSQAVFAPSLTPGTTAVSYGWDFESTGHLSSCPATAPIAIHQYTRGGTFRATLQVLDSAGQTNTIGQAVFVAGPTAPDPLMGKSAPGNVACAKAPPGWLGGPIAASQVAQSCVSTVQLDYGTATALDGCFHSLGLAFSGAASARIPTGQAPPPARPESEALPGRLGSGVPPGLIQSGFSGTSGISIPSSAGQWLAHRDRSVWEAEGSIDFNGLRIDSLDAPMAYPGEPQLPAGGPILVSPFIDYLYAGHARITVANSASVDNGHPITLADRDWVSMVLPDTATPTTPVAFGGFDLAQVSAGLPGVYGFALGGIAQTQLVGNTLVVHADVSLPAPLQMADGTPVTATATFVAVAGRGLQLQSLEFDATNVDLGPFVLNELHVSYQAGPDVWKASGSVYVFENATIAAAIEFQHGSLVKADGSFTETDPGMDVYAPALYLNMISFSIETGPQFAISGSVKFTAGGLYSTPVGNVSAAEINGGLYYANGTYVAGVLVPGPWQLGVNGSLKVAGIGLQNGSLAYISDGSVVFSGHVNIDPFNMGIVRVSADVSGGVYSNGSFDTDVNAQFCVLWGAACAGGEFIVSSKGFGGCLAITGDLGFHWHVGGGYSWGATSPRIMWDSCGVGPWQVAAPQQASYTGVAGGGEVEAVLAHTQPPAAGTYSLTFPAGPADEQVIGVIGAGAPPHITVTGPGGQSAVSQPGRYHTSGRILTVEVPQNNTTYVVVAQPQPGTWTIVPAKGSAPITELRHGSGTPTPKITASVSHTGSAWALHYTVSGATGTPITFEEVGSATRHVLGTVTAASGTLAFDPGDGVAGTRTVQAAVLDSGGAIRTIVPVAVYAAPGRTLPGEPAALSATPDGTGLAVHWSAAANGAHPARYVVESQLSDGRRTQTLVAAGHTTATIPVVYPDERGTIKVAGLLADGTPGAFAVLALPLPAPPATSQQWPYIAGAVALLAVAAGIVLYRRRLKAAGRTQT